MDKVTIEHDHWGRVEGVGHYNHWQLAWCKQGAIYRQADGWREVKAKKWVSWVVPLFEGQTVIDLLDSGRTLIKLPSGYRWKRVEIEKEVNY